MAAPSVRRTRRQRGSIEELPSGALRVSVYAGTDPLTGRRHYLRESISAGPSAQAEAQKAMRRLATEVDERRNLRTNATVNQLLDRHFEFALAELEVNTLANYRGLAEKHIRPLIGSVKVGALDSTGDPLSLRSRYSPLGSLPISTRSAFAAWDGCRTFVQQ
jgi:integrase